MFVLVLGTSTRDHAKHLAYHQLNQALHEALQIFERQPVILSVQVVDQAGKSYFEVVRGQSELVA